MHDKINETFMNKTVVVRGIGSGVNVGIFLGLNGTQVLLDKKNYFCPTWSYDTGHGAMHSLSSANITDGDITMSMYPSVVTDAAQIVECSPKLKTKLDKWAKK